MAPTRPRAGGRARSEAPTPGTRSRSSGATATPRLRRRCSASTRRRRACGGPAPASFPGTTEPAVRQARRQAAGSTSEVSGRPGRRSHRAGSPVPGSGTASLRVGVCTWVTAPAAAARSAPRATTAPDPARLTTKPAAASSSYAATTGPRERPSDSARARVEGRASPGRSRPARSSATTASQSRWRSGAGPSGTSRARSTERATRGIPRPYWSSETNRYWISARASWCGGLVVGRFPRGLVPPPR